jgi:uncharacterized protein
MAIIDAHAHLDERMLQLPAMLRQMSERGVDRVVLIPCMNDPLPHTPKALLWTVRRLLCSPFHDLARRVHQRTMDADGNLRLSGETYRIYSQPDNATVAAALAAHPEHFLGWIFLNPRLPDHLDELERWRGVRGFVGVKLHSHWHDWDIEAALPIAKRCETLGLPILIHLGFGSRGRWQVLANACPKLRLVFAHAGIPHFQRMWHEIAADPRLFLDVSSPYLDEALVREAVRAVGSQRVLYGTDAPYGFVSDDEYDYGEILGWVQRLPAPATEIDRMLGDNVLELLTLQR